MVQQHEDRATSPPARGPGHWPLEDVGGAPGYADYLDAIGDPTHPENENMHF